MSADPPNLLKEGRVQSAYLLKQPQTLCSQIKRHGHLAVPIVHHNMTRYGFHSLTRRTQHSCTGWGALTSAKCSPQREICWAELQLTRAPLLPLHQDHVYSREARTEIYESDSSGVENVEKKFNIQTQNPKSIANYIFYQLCFSGLLQATVITNLTVIIVYIKSVNVCVT